MHFKGSGYAFEAPRDVLMSIPGIEFKEMVRNRALQMCCDAGGVKAGIPNLALDMAQARVKDVEDTGSQIVSSTCPFCCRNIMGARSAASSHVKAVAVVELMAKSMGLDATNPENPSTKFREQDMLV